MISVRAANPSQTFTVYNLPLLRALTCAHALYLEIRQKGRIVQGGDREKLEKGRGVHPWLSVLADFIGPYTPIRSGACLRAKLIRNLLKCQDTILDLSPPQRPPTVAP